MKPVAKVTLKKDMIVNNIQYRAGQQFWVYNVKSFTSEKVYAVWVVISGQACYCSCPDHLNRHRSCKHMSQLQNVLDALKERKAQMAEQKKAVETAEELLKKEREEKAAALKQQQAEERKRRELAPLNGNAGFSLLR